jgi:3-hydroxyisobutyrate dehydrogenase-like beta-hydroxyacid dehydrogenase
VNNLIFLAGALVVQEGFVLAAKAGLGARELLPIINASSAKLYSGMAPLFFARNFEMTLFKLGIAEKDVALALESARELAAPLPLARPRRRPIAAPSTRAAPSRCSSPRCRRSSAPQGSRWTGR